jgi:carboxylesterase
VLCLHGLTSTPYEVRPPAEALVEAGFRCVGPLLPGHGTTWPELARTARSVWLQAALESYDRLARQHRRVYVLGQSMGGALALAICQRRPVPGAVLLATPLHLRRRVRLLVPLLHRWVPSVAKRSSLLDPEARARHPGYPRMPLAAVHQLLLLLREVRADLGRVSAPTRLIYSRGDQTVDPGDAERIRAALGSRRVDLRYVENSGHVVTLDFAREQVAGYVREFLAELEASGRD